MQFTWASLNTYGSPLIEDTDAAGGKAVRLTKGIKGVDHSSRPYSMGVYDRTEKKSIAPGLRLSGKTFHVMKNTIFTILAPPAWVRTA